MTARALAEGLQICFRQHTYSLRENIKSSSLVSSTFSDFLWFCHLTDRGDDQHDLNAMHAQCTPEQARDFTEALATVVQKKKASAKPKRLAKPKELASVVAVTSDIDPVTGERKDKVSASVSAVATMRAREIVKSMGGAAEQGEQMFSLSCTATRFRSKGQTAGTGCRQRAASNAGDRRS